MDGKTKTRDTKTRTKLGTVTYLILLNSKLGTVTYLILLFLSFISFLYFFFSWPADRQWTYAAAEQIFELA